MLMQPEVLPITIYLKKNNSQVLHCMICRSNLGFAVEGIPTLIIEGSNANAGEEKNVKFPIMARCGGRGSKDGNQWRCPAMYIIQGLIDD